MFRFYKQGRQKYKSNLEIWLQSLVLLYLTKKLIEQEIVLFMFTKKYLGRLF